MCDVAQQIKSLKIQIVPIIELRNTQNVLNNYYCKIF